MADILAWFIILGVTISPFYFDHAVYYISIGLMGLSIFGIVAYTVDFNKSKPGNKLSGIVLLGPIIILFINFIVFLFADSPQQ